MEHPRLVVVGSIGLDTIETPSERQADVLGGSVSYACAAASFFTRPGMVGVVGTDFPRRAVALFRRMGVDTRGLQVADGRTFRWSGVYEENMDNRRTLRTDLNVFADFMPELPAAYRRAPFLFLANIAPALQMHVLEQVESPRFVMADTMDLWIRTTPDDLRRVVANVDLLTVNESEARHWTGKHGLLQAARELLRLGPQYVLVKKGEHGSMLVTRQSVFLLPAYPVEDVRDPTGAGDTFAGGFIGRLAAGGRVSEAALRGALVYGGVVASFGVEAFGLDRLSRLTEKEIAARVAQFRRMCRAG